MPRIDAFLKIMQENDASDFHLAAECSPMLRIHGALEKTNHRPLIVTPEETVRYAFERQAILAYGEKVQKPTPTTV